MMHSKRAPSTSTEGPQARHSLDLRQERSLGIFCPASLNSNFSSPHPWHSTANLHSGPQDLAGAFEQLVPPAPPCPHQPDGYYRQAPALCRVSPGHPPTPNRCPQPQVIPPRAPPGVPQGLSQTVPQGLSLRSQQSPPAARASKSEDPGAQ